MPWVNWWKKSFLLKKGGNGHYAASDKYKSSSLQLEHLGDIGFQHLRPPIMSFLVITNMYNAKMALLWGQYDRHGDMRLLQSGRQKELQWNDLSSVINTHKKTSSRTFWSRTYNELWRQLNENFKSEKGVKRGSRENEYRCMQRRAKTENGTSKEEGGDGKSPLLWGKVKATVMSTAAFGLQNKTCFLGNQAPHLSAVFWVVFWQQMHAIKSNPHVFPSLGVAQVSSV